MCSIRCLIHFSLVPLQLLLPSFYLSRIIWFYFTDVCFVCIISIHAFTGRSPDLRFLAGSNLFGTGFLVGSAVLVVIGVALILLAPRERSGQQAAAA